MNQKHVMGLHVWLENVTKQIQHVCVDGTCTLLTVSLQIPTLCHIFA
jgi:hypothetical protein